MAELVHQYELFPARASGGGGEGREPGLHLDCLFPPPTSLISLCSVHVISAALALIPIHSMILALSKEAEHMV